MIEIMVVIAIVGMMMGTVVYGSRALLKTDLRGSATKLAGAIRYCFDRAITTGNYYRIVIDLDGNKYWAERSEDRMYLTGKKEAAPGNGKALDVDAIEKKKTEAEEEEKRNAGYTGVAAQTMEPPPKPKRAQFQTFKDATLPVVTLKRTKLQDVYTRRQREPYKSGRAYLYFFPDGHTERAVIRMADGDDWYSLTVHPLTGRVEVLNGRADISADFDTKDEEGNTEQAR